MTDTNEQIANQLAAAQIHEAQVSIEDDEATIALVGKSEGYPLSQLLDVASKIAAAGLGHDLKVATAENGLVLYFTLLI